MKTKIYQVDAFTDRLFGGNPAAVCPLENWLPDDIMQKIAMENNLAETAFFVKEDDHYRIRWFTPAVEVDLCGHATLASAFVLFHHENYSRDEITFQTQRSGILTVKKDDDYLTMNFPADRAVPAEAPANLDRCFSLRPVSVFKGKTDYLLVYNQEKEIQALVPDFAEISRLECRGVIVTARGEEADFVSRFFAPQSGINEDPVTGSAHTTLLPYWSSILGKTGMTAIQLSKRQGFIKCKHLGERVEISGKCRTYLAGDIFVDVTPPTP